MLQKFLTLALLFALLSLVSAAAEDDAKPLQPFERLVGGQWHLQNTFLVFEWGVGRKSVRARSYRVIAGEAKLVSEGAWYWHAGDGAIKGVFTAIDMPVELFDYTARFEGDTMFFDLSAYAASGNETRFSETWKFVDDSHFEWTLSGVLPDGRAETMSGTYERRD